MSTIIYIGGFELPDRNAAAERVRANALIFRDLGYRVILAGVSRERQADGRMYPAHSGISGVEAFEVGYPKSIGQWFRQIVSAKVLSTLLSRCAVSDLRAVICYNHPAVSQFRMARIARRCGAAAIADCTEWYSDVKNDSIANVVKNVDVSLRMNWVNWRMDGLITTAPFISQHYARIGKPLVELPTLMTNDVSHPPVNIRTDDGRLRLFYAGTGFDIDMVKNSKDGLKDRLDWVIDALFKAKERGARFKLDIYGVDRDKYIELVPHQKLILDELDSWLTFHGRQPRSVLLAELPKCAYSIFFRKATRTTLAGFPTKFSESVSFGTPVITNEIPSVSVYSVKGRNGEMLDLSDEAVVDRLVSLLGKSDGEVNAMKQYCAQSMTFHYSKFLPAVASFMSELVRL